MFINRCNPGKYTQHDLTFAAFDTFTFLYLGLGEWMFQDLQTKI